MAKFTIIIRGIGMIYPKGDQQWNILFPVDGVNLFRNKLKMLFGSSQIARTLKRPLSYYQRFPTP